jgi:uncharacterized membrane protein YfcA
VTAEQILLVTAGALAGGFVSGLAGFGTGLVAIGIWLYAVSPAVAVSLAVICSVMSQVQTIPAIWHAVRPRRVLPFIVPGLIGVPLGIHLLGAVEPPVFKLCVGLLLVGFSTFSLSLGRGLRVTWGGVAADGVVGFAGGVLGGLAGLSGPLPTMWASLRGWGKDERRSLIQAFNLSILMTALVSQAVSGRLTAEVGFAVMASVPGTVVGAWLGTAAYRRLSDRHFHHIILYLLAFSGVTLLWSTL